MGRLDRVIETPRTRPGLNGAATLSITGAVIRSQRALGEDVPENRQSVNRPVIPRSGSSTDAAARVVLPNCEWLDARLPLAAGQLLVGRCRFVVDGTGGGWGVVRAVPR